MEVSRSVLPINIHKNGDFFQLESKLEKRLKQAKCTKFLNENKYENNTFFAY